MGASMTSSKTGWVFLVTLLSFAGQSLVRATAQSLDASAVDDISIKANRQLLQGDGDLGGDGGNGGKSSSPAFSVSSGGSQLGCGPNTYVKNSKCKKCLSAPSSDLEDLQGKKCKKPYARNGPSTCNFGSLDSIVYEDVSSPTCFAHSDGNKFKESVLLPAPGFKYFGLPVTKYIFDSMTLNDYKAVKGDTVDRDGTTYQEVKFTSTDQPDLQGETIYLNGIIVAGGKNICFSSALEVCEAEI